MLLGAHLEWLTGNCYNDSYTRDKMAVLANDSRPPGISVNNIGNGDCPITVSESI